MAQAHLSGVFDDPKEVAAFREGYSDTLGSLRNTAARDDVMRGAATLTAIERIKPAPRNTTNAAVAEAAGIMAAMWDFAEEQAGGFGRRVTQTVLDKTLELVEMINNYSGETWTRYYRNSAAVWAQMESLVAVLGGKGFGDDVTRSAAYLVSRLPYKYVGAALDAYNDRRKAEAKRTIVAFPATKADITVKRSPAAAKYGITCLEACAGQREKLAGKTGAELAALIEAAATLPVAKDGKAIQRGDIARAAGILNALWEYYSAQAHTFDEASRAALKKTTKEAVEKFKAGTYGAIYRRLYLELCVPARALEASEGDSAKAKPAGKARAAVGGKAEVRTLPLRNLFDATFDKTVARLHSAAIHVPDAVDAMKALPALALGDHPDIVIAAAANLAGAWHFLDTTTNRDLARQAMPPFLNKAAGALGALSRRTEQTRALYRDLSAEFWDAVPTLAYALKAYGHAPETVERADALLLSYRKQFPAETETARLQPAPPVRHGSKGLVVAQTASL